MAVANKAGRVRHISAADRPFVEDSHAQGWSEGGDDGDTAVLTVHGIAFALDSDEAPPRS